MIRTILLTLVFLCSFLGAEAQDIIKADTIPFEIGPDNRIYVKVHINGDKSSFRFLVDTGASDVVLNASVPEVMSKAVFTSHAGNTGATSSEQVPSTDGGQSLQVGSNILNGLRFISIAYPPEAWDGVLGLSFLKCYNVAFNYDRKEMYLYPIGTVCNMDGHAVDFEYIDGVPVISAQVTINDKCYTLKTELDSGSDRVFDITTPFVNEHKLRGSLHVFAISSIAGTSATQGNLENVLFDSAEIGNVIFPSLPGAFSTLTNGIQASSRINGIIGNNLHQRFNQYWDFANNKIYLSVNNRFYTPFYDFLIAR